MRQLKLLFILVLLLASSGIEALAAGPKKAWSETDGVYYLKTSDGLESEFVVNGSITFKAVADGSTIPTYKDCGVTFAPASEGEVIKITINSIDLAGGNYLLLYEGDVDVSKIGSSSASDGVDQSRWLPAGWVKKYQSESVGETYIATADNGKLSFGFHSGSANGQTGFNITVTSMSLKDMEFVSAGAISDLNGVNRGASNQAIFGVDVLMDGGSNPMTLSELRIDASALAGSTQVSNVRLYKGESFIADNLLATAANVGDELVATNVTLKSSHNKFMVVADIAPDASGTIPSLTLTSVKIDDEAKTIGSTTGSAVAVNNVILMPSQSQTFTIIDDTEFYDDGGKDGKITLNFTGSVTFVPATDGNAIKVDFSKLALFNTSSIGKDDVFKFYNGRTADENNLIVDLTSTQETSKVVKSTADDGSMTITLVSTTGVAADGWEAVVSQFLPGDMTFKSVSAQISSTTTAAADETDVQMLVVDVVTDNQSNPLALTSLNFNAADVKNVSKVRAYYLGDKNTFSTSQVFGEATVSGNAIAITGEKTLAEGHNYFAVVLDLNGEGENSDEVKLAFTSATVAGVEQTPAETVEAMVVINNICHAVKGSHSHIIKGEWTFTDTKASSYSNKYEAADEDYIVTFTPAEAGTVAQIDFSSFDVYYSNSNYGVKAVFEIYSGTGVNAANVLWQLQDASQASTGPGRVLRSQAADGSMTIRFNPKSTSSYYTGNGWVATVSPFQNHDMEVKSVTVNQTSTDVLAPGSTNNQLIDFNVMTEGTLSLKTIKAVKLNLKDCQEALDKVSVYYNNANDFSTAVLFGAVENLATADVTITGERELVESNNYFWVTIDVKADAPAEAVVDAKLVSLTDAADVVTTVENGDPEGNRVVKYIYYMQEGVSVITVTNPLMFYDDGGPDGNVSASLKGTVTFVPGPENCAIEINATDFSIGSGTMMVYNGMEINADNILGKVTGYSTTTGPANLISKSADGAITIRYEGNTATSLRGWAMVVKLHEKTPFTVESAITTPVNDNVMRNQADAEMQEIKLSVSGDKDPIAVNSVKFTTNGTTDVTDIVDAKLYFTNHNALFSLDNCVATLATVTAGDNVISLDTPIEIADNGDYYLWLTYDVASEATVGNKVAAQVQSLTVGENEIQATGNAAEREIKAGLKGNYIIGASDAANYPTFAAATADLQGGIEGAVTFEVEDGDYAENVKVQNVPGVGVNSPVVFQSQSGDASKVVIKGSGYSDPGYGNHKEGMFLIENTPYVTLRNMSFVPTSQSYPYAIHLYNQSRHATIDGVIVTADPTTSYSGMALVKTEAVNEDGMNNDYFTIQNSTLTGGYIALYLGGTSYVALTREKGLVVRNNTISEPGSKAIYVSDEDDCVIENNVMLQSTTTKNDYNGIDLYRSHNVTIAGNTIQNTQSVYSAGLVMRSQCFDVKAYNNAISITNSPSTSGKAISVDATSKNIELSYNTVRIAGSDGYAYYTANSTSNKSYEGIKVQNNLFQNLTSSIAMFIHANFMGKAEFVNNAFYTANTNGYVLTDTDIDALNGMEGCSANFIEQADFVSETDLHLKTAGNLNAGIPMDYISTDIDGNERDAVHPTLGAYEFAEIVVDTPVIEENYPAVSKVSQTGITFKTKWNVSGKLYSMIQEQTPSNPAPRRAAARIAIKDAPTSEDLLATTPVDVSAGAEVTTTFSNLLPNTNYQAYFMLTSAIDETVCSEIVASEVVLTAPATVLVDLTNPYDVVEAGGSTTIEPSVTGGLEPYTYEWRDQMNNVVGTGATLTVSPEYTYGYKLTVTSADGQTVTAKTGVYVLGDAVTATFDDNYLPANSHFDGDNDDDVFYSGSYAFHVANPGGWWYGYALSNETATSFSGLSDQYHSAAGGGVDGSAFCVAYPSGTTIDVTNNLDGEVLQGMYVTNSAYAKSSMLNGDTYAKKFGQGDWFKLTVTGYDANDAVSGTVDFYLADFRSSDATEHYILDTWEWMDLTSLGTVSSVMFTLSSSDVGQWGMNTPGYVCVDNFNAPLEVLPTSIELNYEDEAIIDLGGQTLQLVATVLPENATNKAVEWTSSNENVATVDETGLVTAVKNGTWSVIPRIQSLDVEPASAVITATSVANPEVSKSVTVVISNPTGVRDIDASKEVKEVKYVNAAGMESYKLFEGVNIIITTFTDGSRTTTKVIK